MSITLPRIECSITFLPENMGGRTAMPILLGNIYRPHIVIGDISQRKSVIAAGDRLKEEYLGVAFDTAMQQLEPGTEIYATLSLFFYPHPGYDELRPGITFTVREGPQIAAYGTVLKGMDT